jgi:hypothetical protein
MPMRNSWIFATVMALSACQGHDAHYEKKQPAKVMQDARGKYLEITPEAERRLGIQGKPARTGDVIPLSALLYDARGTTSVFVKEAGGRYRRRTIEVASQNAKSFTVKNEFETGISIVITGAAELNGTEEGVGK